MGDTYVLFPGGYSEPIECVSVRCPHRQQMNTAHCPNCNQDYKTGVFYCCFPLNLKPTTLAPEGCSWSGETPQQFADVFEKASAEYNRRADEDYKQWRAKRGDECP